MNKIKLNFTSLGNNQKTPIIFIHPLGADHSVFDDVMHLILDTFYCPHGPHSKCHCRKPLPGMFFDAKRKYNTSMQDSWMIGDTETDISAARSAGISNTILVRSGHSVDELNSKATHIINSIKDSINIIRI